MALLYYGTDVAPVTFPDRLLAYVKVITATKLRRGESFTLTWVGDPDTSGRSAIWLHPSIPLRFVFDATDADQLASEYLRVLAEQASASAGLVVDLRSWEDDERAVSSPAAPRTPSVGPAGSARAA